VVRRDLSVCADARGIAPTLQAALDRWEEVEPRLRALAARCERGEVATALFDAREAGPPLPRAYEWLDGSAFLSHVRLARRARGAEPPDSLETDPLVYQGGSGVLLGPTAPIAHQDPDWGLDFEAEVAVILGEVPLGTQAAGAERCVRLLCLANDVTLRNLVPRELAKQFGFLQSKPATAFSPVACTPDELGAAWRGGRVHLRLHSTLNGARVGDPDAGPEMHFSFFDLIGHIARTRAFTPGTILGSGTVSNLDRARGASCLVEQRMRESLELGRPVTPFLAPGDRVAIEMFGADGASLFGRIDQLVVAA
jgi:fumarylacetoacetate (FAA) hydrolase